MLNNLLQASEAKDLIRQLLHVTDINQGAAAPSDTAGQHVWHPIAWGMLLVGIFGFGLAAQLGPVTQLG